jgi:hypothetical protein
MASVYKALKSVALSAWSTPPVGTPKDLNENVFGFTLHSSLPG